MKTGFVLFATQRSGTTALRHALNACPDIEMYGESYFPSMFDWGFYQFFADQVARDATAVLPERRYRIYKDHFISLQDNHPAQHVGMDVKYSDVEANPQLAKALGETGAVAVHLRRQNMLKTHVSNMTMNKRVKERMIAEADIHSAKVAPVTQVWIDPKTIVSLLDQRVNAIIRHDQTLRKMFPKVVQLNYEDLFEVVGDTSQVRPRARNAIKAALGLEWEGEFACDLKKQNPERLSDLIENFEDVETAINSSRYFYMLEGAA